MKRELVVQIAALVALVGFVCFAGGYYADDAEITAYATTREISVNVKVETKEMGTIQKTVTIRDGMTPFDAMLKVTDLQTKYWESYGTSTIRSVTGDNLGAGDGI